MKRSRQSAAGAVLPALVGALLWVSALGDYAGGYEVKLKDGRTLKGKLVPLPGVSAAPSIPGSDAAPIDMIVMLDDGLRRTYVGKRQVASAGPEQGAETPELFKVRQQARHGTSQIKGVGTIFGITEFDEFGRRRLKMNTAKGTIDVVQGITEIWPSYVKVEGINYAWDMRLATSSLKPDVLHKVLAHETKQDDLEQRKKVVRFYLQCERYGQAAAELQAILQAFPSEEVKKQLEQPLQQIRQLTARQVLEELKARRDSGQHRMVLQLLKKFPTEGPAGDTIQAVREVLKEYEGQEAAKAKVLKQFDEQLDKIADKALRDRIKKIRDEMVVELGPNTMLRMAAFREMVDAQDLKPEEKVALAISCWLVEKGATTKLSTALSLIEVRALIRDYFAATDKVARAKVLHGFQSQEGATLDLVAKLLANMKPPVATEPPDDLAKPYELEVPGPTNAPAVRYLVQLPPEYDPYRRYPAIVTLHGAATTPEEQVDWWAGEFKDGWRRGQASRYGYIVIAPGWTSDHQKGYGYTAREHAAVLDSLRDACRRFSIDTDRVFLSGHAMGGDAAWDIGLAHPDLWAGVIPIAAKGDRYCAHYWPNAELLPFYFVCGELDSPRAVAANARDWDRYFLHGYNSTIVEFLGRGHENFSDEILRIFDWMGHFRRNFFPREFTVASMRPWDNFFWWVELKNLPERSVVDPAEWSSSNRRGTKPMQTKAWVTKTGTLGVQTGAGLVTVWLTPELADLGRKVNVTVNGRRPPNASAITPDLATLLEDARTRADRQHPFWAKWETGASRAGERETSGR